jgi:hypothetical protein
LTVKASNAKQATTKHGLHSGARRQKHELRLKLFTPSSSAYGFIAETDCVKKRWKEIVMMSPMCSDHVRRLQLSNIPKQRNGERSGDPSPD